MSSPSLLQDKGGTYFTGGVIVQSEGACFFIVCGGFTSLPFLMSEVPPPPPLHPIRQATRQNAATKPISFFMAHLQLVEGKPRLDT
jgi:hypothetical protein